MWEVVHAVSREHVGYYPDYVAAADAADAGDEGELYEVWTLADDECRTRMVRHGIHRGRGAKAVA